MLPLKNAGYTGNELSVRKAGLSFSYIQTRTNASSAFGVCVSLSVCQTQSFFWFSIRNLCKAKYAIIQKQAWTNDRTRNLCLGSYWPVTKTLLNGTSKKKKNDFVQTPLSLLSCTFQQCSRSLEIPARMLRLGVPVEHMILHVAGERRAQAPMSQSFSTKCANVHIYSATIPSQAYRSNAPHSLPTHVIGIIIMIMIIISIACFPIRFENVHTRTTFADM